MSKILLASSSALIALSVCFGLVSDVDAASRSVCERVRHVCLGTGKSAEFCQANFEHCRKDKTFTGGLTSDDLAGAPSVWSTWSRHQGHDPHPTPASVEVQTPGSTVSGGGRASIRVIGPRRRLTGSGW